jgi:hypothetical protein
MLTSEELSLTVRALESHRVRCANAIDGLVTLWKTDDPWYTYMSKSLHSDIADTQALIDKINNRV